MVPILAPRSVGELMELLARGEGTYDELDVDGLAHALQCGARLHAMHPDDDELVAAGLVHDIADIASPDDHDDHATRGAALVEPLLGTRVARLVGAHVDAKRYLVATDAGYRARLSPRSIETLAAQGDALDARAAAALACNPEIDAILALRRADEAAKDPGARPPALHTWRPLLERLASGTA